MCATEKMTQYTSRGGHGRTTKHTAAEKVTQGTTYKVQFLPSVGRRAKCSLQMRKPGSSRITWQVAWASVLLSQPPSFKLPPGASFHLFACPAEGWSSPKLPSIPFSLHSDSSCFPSSFKYLLSTYCVLGPMMGRGDTSALVRMAFKGGETGAFTSVQVNDTEASFALAPPRALYLILYW